MIIQHLMSVPVSKASVRCGFTVVVEDVLTPPPTALVSDNYGETLSQSGSLLFSYSDNCLLQLLGPGALEENKLELELLFQGKI